MPNLLSAGIGFLAAFIISFFIFRLFYRFLKSGFELITFFYTSILIVLFMKLCLVEDPLSNSRNLVFLFMILTFIFILQHIYHWYQKKMYLRELIKELQLATTQKRSIIEALENLEKQADHKVAPVLKQIKDLFLETGSLAQALDYYPRYFSYHLREVIRFSEENNLLDKTLPYLYDENNIKDQNFSLAFLNWAYLCIFFGIFTFLFTGILPKFKAIVDATEISQSELSIRLLNELIAFGLILKSNGFELIICLICFAIFMHYRHISIFSFFATHLPIFRKTMYGYSLARYATTMSMLLKSHCSFQKAHEISANSEPNRYLRKKYNKISPQLQEGIHYAQAIEDLSIPKNYKTRLKNASLHSSVADRFLYVGNSLFKEVTHFCSMINRSIYPISVIFLGILIGLVLFVIFDFNALVHTKIYH